MGDTPPQTEVIRPAETVEESEAFSEVRVPLQAESTDVGSAAAEGGAALILVPIGTPERGAFDFEPDDSWYSFQKEMEKDIGFAFPHDEPPEGTRMLEKIDGGQF
jgi:hypothetical protein